MKLLKKIGLFIVFFVTLSQAMGNSTSCFQEQLVAIEINENSCPSYVHFSTDIDEIEDENSVNAIIPHYCLINPKQKILDKNYQLKTQFNFTFWQPPKIS